MAFDITDDSELIIYITDGWREWYLPKFRIFMVVDEPYISIYWTDTEKGRSGLTRILRLDYADVTFGYLTPSSAGEVEIEINAMIISAWSGSGATPAGPDGAIQFNDGGTFGGEAELYWSKTDDRLGINTDTPECTLDIKSQGTGNTRGAQITHYDNTTAFSQAKFIGRRSRGSVGSPTAVQANDTLVSFNARGRKATAWSDTVGGHYIYAAENWTDIATGTYLTWRGVPTGGVTVAEWMRLNQSGLTLASLAGVGTRMVIADASGVLSTQAIYDLPVSTETADLTLDLTQAWTVLVCDTVTSLEITIPTNASVAFPIGTRIAINAIDNGLVYAFPSGGVTLQSVDNFTGIIIDGGWAWLTKIGTDSWNLEGDLRIALDADAEAYIDAVVATGVTFTDAEKGYINDFFLELKSQSIYTKFYFIYLFLGATAAAHKFNAVNPLDSDAAHRMLFTGSPTHNVNGVTFNGSTQYGDTRFQPSIDMAQDSKNYTIYAKTNGVGFLFGSQNSGAPYQADNLSGNFSSGGLVYWGLSVAPETVANPSPNTGIYSVNRDTSTSASLKRADSSIDTITAASSYNPSFYVYIGARNWGGAPTNAVSVNQYNACNIAYFSGASELTSGEETILYNAITTLNTAFGR